MSVVADFHMHTRYCDGAASVEDMVRAAIARGCKAVGVSGHSPISGENWCMALETVPAYHSEMKKMKEDCQGIIEVLVGVEQDICSPPPTVNYDFIIGSVHTVTQRGVRLSVNEAAETAERGVRELFGGDWYAYAEAYYAQEAEVVHLTGSDIIGHFDLITKYNENGRQFDESHPRYRRAALDAVHALLETGKLFEVNTGAMAQGYKSTPYPALWILKEIHAGGGNIILSSDSHRTNDICYRFDFAAALARAAGFTTAYILAHVGATEIPL
jgi:histidinol-phosphatase (PHP family)